MGKWISVKDKAPEVATRVLALHPEGRIEIEDYIPYLDIGFSYDGLYGPATHWMPLPGQPEEAQAMARWEQVDKWRVRCPNCGEVRPDTEPRKFCPECGARLEVAGC